MEGRHGSTGARERPVSRADSFTSTHDGRRSGNRSRNSSMLPYSTRSDGSTFYHGEVSTLSRAVLHTTDDDEAGDTIRETRPGWHRRRRDTEDGASERDEAEEQDEMNDDDDDAAYDDVERSRGAERRHRDASARSVSFHLTPFHGDHDLDSFSVNDRSASSYTSRSARYAGGGRRGRSYTSQSDYPSISNASSSFQDCEEASYSMLNSRLGRPGQRPFATLQDSLHVGDGRRRGEDAASLPASTASASAAAAVAGGGGPSASSSTRGDGTTPRRRPGAVPRPPVLATGSLGATSRLSLHSGDFSERGSTKLSPVSGGGSASAASRQRRSASVMSKASDTADGLVSPSKKRDCAGGEERGTATSAEGISPDRSFTPPFTAYSSQDSHHHKGASVVSVLATLSAEDRVWPYTQALDVRLIMSEVRKQIEWNHTMRQFLLLLPLLFLVAFLCAFNATAIQTDLLVTEAQRQIFTRTPFPSAATALERYRQQTALNLQVSVPTDRIFVDIRTQMDWIDYFADVLLPGIFPGVIDNSFPDLMKPVECLDNVTVVDVTSSSSSSGDGCFDGDQFWWDKPGCSPSLSNDDLYGIEVGARTVGSAARTLARRRAALTRLNTSGVEHGNPRTDASAPFQRQPAKSGGGANTDAASPSSGAAVATAGAASSSSSNSASSDSRSDDDACSGENFLYSNIARVGPAQNYYLGALRVRTIRMRPHSAKLQRSLYPSNRKNFPFDAWSAHHSRADEDTTPTRCPSITLRNVTTNATTPLYRYRAPEMNDPYCVPITGRFGTYHCGGYTFDIPFRATGWLASRYWLAMRNTSCFFVDNWATRLAVAEFFTYTPDHDMFHMVKLRSEVLAGGSYHNEGIYRSFRVWTPARTGELVYVTVTFVYGILYFVFLLGRLRWQVRLFGWAATLKDASAWMDLCMLTSLVLSAAFYYAWARLSASVSAKIRLPMESNDYPSYLDVVQRAYERIGIAVAFCVLLCFARLFFFRVLIRPMSTFVAALSLSMPTLLATAVLFFIILISYAMAAYAVFGPACEYYTTFGSALYAVLSFWYAVPFLIPTESEAARQFTSLFFWSLSVVLLCLSVATCNAIVAHAFARIQAVYGVTYDEVWIVRRVKAIGEGLTWPRLRRFVAKMALVHHESEYLLALLASMSAAYFSDGTVGDRSNSNSISNTDESRDGGPGRGPHDGALSSATSLPEQPSSPLSRFPEKNKTAPAAALFHEGVASSSTTSPTSFNEKGRRLAAASSIVEGQAYDPTVSTSTSTQRLSREEQAAHGHRPSKGSQLNTSSSATQDTAEVSAEARRLAAVAFSAVETQNPLAPPSSAAAASTTPPACFSCGREEGSAARRNGDTNRGIADFRTQVRRTSDELRELYDDLRQLTLRQLHVDFFAWCEVIPPEVFEKCGGVEFFKECWREMAEAQADVLRTPQQQARREFRGKVALATEREVAGGIVGIGHLENTLTQLELHVDSLLQNVSKR